MFAELKELHIKQTKELKNLENACRWDEHGPPVYDNVAKVWYPERLPQFMKDAMDISHSVSLYNKTATLTINVTDMKHFQTFTPLMTSPTKVHYAGNLYRVRCETFGCNVVEEEYIFCCPIDS